MAVTRDRFEQSPSYEQYRAQTPSRERATNERAVRVVEDDPTVLAKAGTAAARRRTADEAA